jgi:hypothetical protein
MQGAPAGETGAPKYWKDLLKQVETKNNVRDCYKKNSGNIDWLLLGKIVAYAFA